MALCDRGYLCDVCGKEVETIDDSDLYLRYVIGEVDPESLHSCQERHLRCNPTLSQFVVADGFEPVVVAGYFGKAQLDPAFVAAEEARVTRGYRRLKELLTLDLPITEYPLPEVIARWRGEAEDRSGEAPRSGPTPPNGVRSDPVCGQHPGF